jgi:hypothetical protein
MMAGEVWRDERKRPGPWPQGRRAPLAVVAAIAVGVLVSGGLGRVHSHVVLGVLVIVISLSGFYTTARLTPERLVAERYTRGPGWFLGVGIAKLPLPVARAVWLLLSLSICALGVLELVSSH